MAHCTAAAIIEEDARLLAVRASQLAASEIGRICQERGTCRVVFATGSSQIALLDELVSNREIDWPRVEAFHLDEYLGLSADHPASFRHFLRERLTSRAPVGKFHWIDGMAADPTAECSRLNALIAARPIDLAFVGIGENGHLAFNDPPADFETDRPFLVVDLDEACRKQQVGEGWFDRIDKVPARAISMSIRQIMSATRILCSALERRKSRPVAAALQGPVTPWVPASILQRHPSVQYYLDRAAAALLTFE